MLIEAIVPLKVRLRSGAIDLQPGQPVHFSDEDGRKLLERARGRVRLCPPSIQPGDTITWQRAGKAYQGVVDFIHVDDTGTRWAFVTIGESWSAVNLKYAVRVKA